MERTFERRGCECNLHIIEDTVHITVTRLDDRSKTETVEHKLFNPYAFYGYDYEDAIVIDAILDRLLYLYGDPETEE